MSSDLNKRGIANEIKGGVKQGAGKARKVVGKLIGSDSEQLKGAAKELEGKAQRIVGKAQRKAADDK